VRAIDPQKPPLPVLRWFGVFGLALAWWVGGAYTSPPGDWIPYAAVAGALILPDIAGFAIGGFRLDLQQAEDTIARLQADVNAQARSSSTSILAIGSDFLGDLRTWARSAKDISSDQATGAAPWQDPGDVDNEAGQDITS